MRALHLVRARQIVPALLLGWTSIAGAQLANASTTATALSGAFTARATGYNAVAWNPANLAMPGNPGFSFTLLAVDGSAGLRPIDLNKIHDYQGQFVPTSVREQWLLDVTAQDGQKGGVGGGLTELGLSLGSFAFQLSTKVASDVNLAPDAVEAILFGNAGRTGTVKALNLAGSSLQGAAYSTGAVSYGLPLTSLIPLANFAVGATVKYTVGHGMVLGLDNGSAVNTSDITLNFPAVIPDTSGGKAKSGNLGSGVGLDLGGAWTIPGFRFGVNVQNVVNTFKWDTTKFVVRPVSGLFNVDTSYTNSKGPDQPYSTAPAALRAKVAAMKFKPVIAAGMSFDWLPQMTVSADIRQQAGDGIEVGPKSLIAAGVEYRIIPFIPLRAGVSTMTGGFGVSGGLGVHVLGFEMGIAGFLRKRDGGTESGGTLSVFSINP
jgi:Outer membrane protein transport protein (OMPP1/FadL/TodX).